MEGRSFTDSQKPQASRWIEGQFGSWADSLSDSEHDAVAAYKGEAYEQINQALRHRLALGDEQREQVSGLDQALSRSRLSEPVIVYRGFRLPGVLTAGTRFRDRGYFSTTLMAQYALGFLELGSTAEGIPTLARVLLPAGLKCGAPDLVEFCAEVEILLPRGSRFFVSATSRPTRTAPYWRVDLEALP